MAKTHRYNFKSSREGKHNQASANHNRGRKPRNESYKFTPDLYKNGKKRGTVKRVNTKGSVATSIREKIMRIVAMQGTATSGTIFSMIRLDHSIDELTLSMMLSHLIREGQLLGDELSGYVIATAITRGSTKRKETKTERKRMANRRVKAITDPLKQLEKNPAPKGKKPGKDVGLLSGVGVMATWYSLLDNNEKLAKARNAKGKGPKPLTDEQMAERMTKEFPKRKTATNVSVAAIRRKYNEGDLIADAQKPRRLSRKYNNNGRSIPYKYKGRTIL